MYRYVLYGTVWYMVYGRLWYHTIYTSSGTYIHMKHVIAPPFLFRGDQPMISSCSFASVWFFVGHSVLFSYIPPQSIQAWFVSLLHTSIRMASRNSGTRVVVMAVTGTLAAIGVGTVYLPFIADKDKVRGLHEESEMDERSKQEYEAMVRQMGAQQAPADKAAEQPPPPRQSNSMWSRLKRSP